MGDIQKEIMKDFPKSNLVYRRNLFNVNLGMGMDQKGEEVPLKEPENIPPEKIWQFESNSGTKLNITTSSLDMSSVSHKTYDNGDDNNKKFRYAIEKAVGTFIRETSLPFINRIGLRYIDHCPLPKKDNETLREWYNSKFPLDFEIADAETMAFQTKVKKGELYLGYVEALAKIKGEDKLILDFDGSAVDIEASDYLAKADALHALIIDEYTKTIKGNTGPLYQLMKKA